MNHLYLFVVLLFISSITKAQTADFPKSWKGEVAIHSSNGNHKVPMSLMIQSLDSVRWSWTLHYEAPNQNPRKYELIQDKFGWKIDEKKLSSNNPKKAYKCIGYDVEKLRKTINNSNLEDAHHFLRIIKEHLPSSLYNEIFKFKKYKFNIVKNWEL